MFRIAREKKALVQNAYSMGTQGISWHLNFRRALRSFEADNLNELIAQLMEFPVDPGGDDELIWTDDSSGFFSVKSMTEVMN